MIIYAVSVCQYGIGIYLDILAVSCDSFDPATNKIIGRQQGSRNHLDSLLKARKWCTNYKVFCASFVLIFPFIICVIINAEFFS